MKLHFSWRAAAAARACSILFLTCAAASASAQPSDSGWKAGAVLDLSAASRELALGQRDKGLGLGHSDINLSGPIGPFLQGQVTAVAHTLERKLETELEEAWVQTRTLPAGLQLRAGRFSSQLGYLNEQHPHSDDFIQRPLLHRAFLGGHWVDDGVRINWTAPTDLYLRLGLEAFRGRGLLEEGRSRGRPGALVLSSRVGGDWGSQQSWQAGLSFMHNRRDASVEGHEADDHEAGHEAAQAHAHGASFSGRRMWLGDITWKWAPQGNNSQQQVRVSYEHAVISGLGPLSLSGDRHHASYLSGVWRFAPFWEAGVRTDLLRVRQLHEGQFEDGRLRETALMLAYKPSHAQTVRLQVTRQQDRGGFAAATHAIQIQYILNLGAHAAHAF